MFLTAYLGENKNHSGLMLNLSKKEMVRETQAIPPFPHILQSGTKPSSQTQSKTGTVLCCTQFFGMLMIHALKKKTQNPTTRMS